MTKMDKRGNRKSEYLTVKEIQFVIKTFTLRNLLGWPKSLFRFFCMMALVVLSCSYFIINNFVRLYCDSCHIGVHLKKTSKLVSFCVAILILKMEEDTQHFWHIKLYYFKKGKNTTETKKDLCSSTWSKCCD